MWLHVALPLPLYRTFTYALPDGQPVPQPGCRVRVPFAHRKAVGVVVDAGDETELPAERITTLERVLDSRPVFPPDLWWLLNWAAGYYQHPLGEVLFTALPLPLREGKATRPTDAGCWQATGSGQQALRDGLLRRAKVRSALLEWLRQPRDVAALKGFHKHWRRHLRTLEEAGWVAQVAGPKARALAVAQRHALNAEQQKAVDALPLTGFSVTLLQGVTGSGKTEVYMALMETVLNQGRQVLVLVPEIGLTPQLLRRLERGTGWPVLALHSGLTDVERQRVHWQAREGEAAIVVGTRSAVFTPFADLGLIVVDEEHDGSYKQQDGFRYHARDLAVARGRKLDIPVVLGSATPSLESLWNVRQGRYRLQRLRQRAGGASLPRMRLLDLRLEQGEHGLSQRMKEAVEQAVNAGHQALLFINQRGYAPVQFCPQCGWQGHCPDCDRPMIVHRKAGWLRCHHCRRQERLPRGCPDCGHESLVYVGSGTQRVTEAVEAAFPGIPVIRVDRDSSRNVNQFQRLLQPVRTGKPCVLVGTQMLAKGHDYPNIGLVGVLQADQSLFSLDFRAQEHLAQLLLQVAGRAGRGRQPGEVLIQTWQPEHGFFSTLLQQGYDALAEQWLEERQLLGLPPVGHMALLRAEARDREVCEGFLLQLQQGLPAALQAQVTGPLPSFMQRKAGFYRYLLVIQAGERRQRHACLQALLAAAQGIRRRKGLRWWVDVDPQDPF